MKKWSLKHLLILAMLAAVQVICARFLSIHTQITNIGTSFIPTALAGMLFGPVSGAVVGGLGDFVGALLFPSGPYFFGFTATAALLGAIFGWFLKKKRTPARVIPCVLTEQLVCTILLNSLWISILYGSKFSLLLLTRLKQAAVMTPVQIIVLLAMGSLLKKYGRYLQAE